ncbi:MAG TPA: hypothetical protein IAA10_07690 [Candidatus Blautia intestinavium]|nr:hypothetical protein [Candidatus Blautia intestinavium]
MNLPRKSHILSLIEKRYHIFAGKSRFPAETGPAETIASIAETIGRESFGA